LDTFLDAVSGQFLKVFTVLPLKYGAVAAKEMVSAAALVTPVLVELVVDMLPELLLFNLDGSILFVLEAAVGMLAGTLTPLVLVSVEVVPVG
jgi:hypothetical protein